MNEKQERIRLLETQIKRLQRRIDRWRPISDRYSWTRVSIFFVGLALSVAALITVGWWLAVPLLLLALLIFGIVAHFQGKLDRSISRHALLMHITAAHVARIKLDWEQIPAVPTVDPRGEHPFEFDLDITGQRSVHQLLNTAISHEGSARLRDWLLQRTPDLATTRKRQSLVRELTPLTRFRDQLILNSLLASQRFKEQMEGKVLLDWLKQQDPPSSLRLLLWVSAALNVLTVVLLVLGALLPMPQLWVYSLAAAVLLFFATGNKRGDIFEGATYLRYGFATLSSIFSYLEHYPYGPHQQLRTLCAPFFANPASRPSKLLAGTARIAAAATLKNNGLLWLIVNALMPWDLYCAYQLSHYKAQIATQLPVWLDTWYELEALCSLATFAYLNPGYTMPTLEASTQGQGRPVLRARDLGHPLLVEEKKVTNDFTLDELGEVIIITGSNMAGKSTFLRTLGVNLCLAYAGAPVNAHSFDSIVFRLFTCIRVTDSVTDGYSYFYAEVRRLRALLEALAEPEQPPLFFLIDEIFKGTNNRERLIGSRSYVRALAGRNCAGLISTHDLDLVKLADVLPQVLNMHFREEVVEGQLVFDYILRSGPSPTTNALKIMEMEGLPIEDVP